MFKNKLKLHFWGVKQFFIKNVFGLLIKRKDRLGLYNCIKVKILLQMPYLGRVVINNVLWKPYVGQSAAIFYHCY